MARHTKLLLVALTAVLALSIGAGTAGALRSISINGSTTVTGSGSVTFVSTGGGVTIRCDVTVTRTLSRAIPKVAGILLGKITRIATNRPEARCTSSLGSLQGIIILGIEREENSRLFFRSITGTLPNITGINKTITGTLIGFSTRIVIIGTITCLYREDGNGIEVRENLNAERRFISAEILRNRAIILPGQPGTCPREGELSGTLTVSGGPILTLI